MKRDRTSVLIPNVGALEGAQAEAVDAGEDVVGGLGPAEGLIPEAGEETAIVTREDGSYLIDGLNGRRVDKLLVTAGAEQTQPAPPITN